MGRIFYWLFIIAGIVAVSILLLLNALKPAVAPTADAAATQAVKHDISSKYNVSESQISILSVTAENWPTSCLGVNKIGFVCAQIVTPGYDIVAKANGITYDYHTNKTGSAVVLVNNY